MTEVSSAHPDSEVEVWSFDEHRLGLQPIMRRQWAKKGSRLRADVQTVYEWFYLYGFVHPSSGSTHWLLLPRVNHEVFSIALKLFAEDAKASTNKQIVLVLDRAGWHTTEKLKVPENIHLVFLPPYSPELQPAERLWSITDEPLVNKTFNTIAAMEEVVAQRCRWIMAEAKALVRGLTNFHWWPQDLLALNAPN